MMNRRGWVQEGEGKDRGEGRGGWGGKGKGREWRGPWHLSVNFLRITYGMIAIMIRVLIFCCILRRVKSLLLVRFK